MASSSDCGRTPIRTSPCSFRLATSSRRWRTEPELKLVHDTHATLLDHRPGRCCARLDSIFGYGSLLMRTRHLLVLSFLVPAFFLLGGWSYVAGQEKTPS